MPVAKGFAVCSSVLSAWLTALEMFKVWCSLTSTVPVGSWICPSDACFTAFADSFTAIVDAVGAAAGDDGEEVLTGFEMPNWSDHWKSPVFAMILRP